MERARNKTLVVVAALIAIPPLHLHAQCAGKVDPLALAAACTARATPAATEGQIDPSHPYRLDELIDLAEQNNPETRIAWESAKQAANRMGIERSAYYPHLAALAFFGDQRMINPFPEPLAPRGYVMVEIPVAQGGVGLEYDVFDFGKRGARLESSKASRLAAVAAFQKTNQDVAFRVVTSYYNLITAQERLDAAQQVVKTAETTQQAAEAQLANGRATRPDVLNAQAATAQAAFDLQASIGAETEARVALREVIGVEPSDEIKVQAPEVPASPDELSVSAAKLVDLAKQNRPDLTALSERLHAATADRRAARSEYGPTIHLDASAAQSAIWPTADYGSLGNANETIWNVGLSVRWTIFDGGQRKNEVRLADSQAREASEALRAKEDQVTREVWTSYVQYQTAVRQQIAANTLLASAEASYDASLDAYRYGVKNLVDVVAAENQLAQARFASVQSHSSTQVSAINLDYRTGILLRQAPQPAQPSKVHP